MLIDWFTVVAQLLNFLILVWLLRRFLYKPILRAIDERERRTATQIADAEKKKAEAQQESAEYKIKNEEFDRQRALLLSKATEEANSERQRLFQEAREAVSDLKAKQHRSLINEAHELKQTISRRIQQEVFAIAKKALTDLATTSLEERLSEAFITRLREVDGQMKADLNEALKTASGPALLRSAFDLPNEQQKAIKNAINEIFSSEIQVRFETAPDLVGGIELTSNGQKIAWSISDYLNSLEESVDELIMQMDIASTRDENKLEPNPDNRMKNQPESKS